MNDLRVKSRKLIKLSDNIKAEADVTASYGWGSNVKFENDKLKSISSAQKSSLSLRLINKSRTGISGTTKVTDGEIDDIFEDAVKLSSFGKKVAFSLPKKKSIKKAPKTYHPGVEKLNEEKFVDLGREIIEKIKKKEPEMKVNSISFSKRTGGSYFVNSNGVEDEGKDSSTSFSVEISKIQEGDFFQLYKADSSIKADIQYKKLVDELLQMASWGNRIAKINSGTYPVVFTPEATDDAIGFILTSLNGKAINEGSSKFIGKLGKKLFDERLSIVDDPTRDYYFGSYLLDDEGVQGTKKELIKRGVVNKFYYDLFEASRAGVKSTGNGERSGIYGHSSPSLSNVIIKPGNKTSTDLIKQIDEGLLVYDFLGSGQNNPYNGDFQLGVYMGYKIEKGEIVGRVKSTSIAGNAFDLLKNNLMWLSKDVKRLGSYEAPYICLDNVVVVSKN